MAANQHPTIAPMAGESKANSRLLFGLQKDGDQSMRSERLQSELDGRKGSNKPSINDVLVVRYGKCKRSH